MAWALSGAGMMPSAFENCTAAANVSSCLTAEGIIPAPESAHAIRVAIDEALQAKQAGQKRVIAFNLSGHGHFDMMAYQAYQRGDLKDYEYPAEKVREALATLPRVP